MRRAPGASFVALTLGVAVLLGCCVAGDALIGRSVLEPTANVILSGPYSAELRRIAAERAGAGACGTDASVDFIPWMRYAADRVAADGALPLWRDTASCGAPFLGAAQPALLLPWNLALAWLGAPAVGHAFLLVLKIALAFFFMALLACHLGTGMLGAWIAGAAFALGGFSMFFAQFPLTNATMLLPLLVLLADRLVLAPSARTAALLALAAGLQHLGGHPESTLHAQLLVVALAAWRSVSRRDGSGPATRRVLAVIAALALGLAIGCAQVVPFLEYLANGDALAHRGSATRHATSGVSGLGALFLVSLAATLWSGRALANGTMRALPAGLALFASLLAALALRRMTSGPAFPVTLLAADWLGGRCGPTSPSDGFLDMLPFTGPAFGLAIAGLLFARPPGLAKGVAMIAVLALFLGYESPILTPLLGSIPPLSLAVNSRLLVFCMAACALLAGLGADALLRGALEPGSRGRYVAACGAIAAAIVASFAADVAFARTLRPPLEGSLRRAQPLSAVFRGQGVTGDGTQRWVAGLARLAAPARSAVAIHGAGAVAPVEMLPIAAGDVAKDGAMPDGDAPLYVFRATLPIAAMPDRAPPLRLLVEDESGATWRSGLLNADARGVASWLAAAIAPRCRAAWVELACLLAAFLACIALAGDTRLRTPLSVALAVIVAGGLVSFARGLVPRVPPELDYPRAPLHDALARSSADARIFGPEVLSPEIATYFGLKDVLGYDVIHPRHTAALLRAALEPDGNPALRIEQLRIDRPDLRLLGLMAVRWQVMPHVAPDRPAAFRGDGGCAAIENPAYLPRARLVEGAIVQPDDARAIDLLRDPAFDLSHAIVLAGGAPARSTDSPPGTARIAVDAPDRVAIDVDVARDAWLVLADSFFPGWTATVDGNERPIERANVAFRAVAVHPGDRSVEFRYAPASVRLGFALSGLGLIAAIALWLRRPR